MSNCKYCGSLMVKRVLSQYHSIVQKKTFVVTHYTCPNKGRLIKTNFWERFKGQGGLKEEKHESRYEYEENKDEVHHGE